MMNFIERVGNIKVYTKRNAEKDLTVIFYNGSDEVLHDSYFTDDTDGAIENLFEKLDIYTEENIWLDCLSNGLQKLSDNTYKLGERDWFCRIENTKYFQHFSKLADEFIKDKNGMRIIDM